MLCRLSAIVVLVLVGAAPMAAAQDTRAEELRAQREAKSSQLQEAKHSGLEGLIYTIEDNNVVERILLPPRGFHLRVGGIGEGAGFGLGPGYRYSTGDFDFHVSAAGSFKRYGIAEASLLLPGAIHDGPFAELHVRRRDFPQEDFFGLGPDSLEEDRSNYALRDTLVRGTGGLRLGDFPGGHSDFTAGASVSWLDPSIGHGKDTRMPSTEEIFDPATIPGFESQPAFIIIEPFVEYGNTDPPFNPTTGGRYRVSWKRYDDRDLDSFSFNRWDLDARQYIPFLNRTHTIALRGWLSSSDPDSENEVPFYLQPTLGGSYSLRGFRTFRFRDRSAALLQAEYRWRINEFAYGALFYETGAVARRVSDLDSFEKDYGIGLRVGSRNGIAFRIDLALGSGEGTRFLIRFDDVF